MLRRRSVESNSGCKVVILFFCLAQVECGRADEADSRPIIDKDFVLQVETLAFLRRAELLVHWNPVSGVWIPAVARQSHASGLLIQTEIS